MRKPRRLHLSDKCMLSQTIRLPLNGELTSHSTEVWIDTHPDLLYYHIYKFKEMKIKPVRLTKDGINKFKEVLKERHPKLYRELQFKKAMHYLRASKR